MKAAGEDLCVRRGAVGRQPPVVLGPHRPRDRPPRTREVDRGCSASLSSEKFSDDATSGDALDSPPTVPWPRVTQWPPTNARTKTWSSPPARCEKTAHGTSRCPLRERAARVVGAAVERRRQEALGINARERIVVDREAGRQVDERRRAGAAHADEGHGDGCGEGDGPYHSPPVDARRARLIPSLGPCEAAAGDRRGLFRRAVPPPASSWRPSARASSRWRPRCQTAIARPPRRPAGRARRACRPRSTYRSRRTARRPGSRS